MKEVALVVVEIQNHNENPTIFRGGDQCQARRGDAGGAGLVPGPARESADTQGQC